MSSSLDRSRQAPTLVQFAYAVPYSGPNVTIEQRMPAVLNQVTVMAQKVGEMRAQLSERRAASGDVGAGRDLHRRPGPRRESGGCRVVFVQRVAACRRGGPATPPWRLRARFSLPGRGRACGHAARSPCRPIERVSRRDATGSSPSSPRLNSAAASGDLDPSEHALRRRELITELESVYAALDH